MYPRGVAIDSTGNLFIAESLGHRVRKVAADGTIATVAGTGNGGYNGDGTAATAMLYFPAAVAIDPAGNVLIADSNNNRIRKLNTLGMISTIAGTGTRGSTGDSHAATSALINSPTGIAVDTFGNFYISEFSGSRIRMVEASGLISTIAGNGISGFSGDDGPAIWAQIKNPNGISLDLAGNLLVADTGNNRIRKIGLDMVRRRRGQLISQ